MPLVTDEFTTSRTGGARFRLRYLRHGRRTDKTPLTPGGHLWLGRRGPALPSMYLAGEEGPELLRLGIERLRLCERAPDDPPGHGRDAGYTAEWAGRMHSYAPSFPAPEGGRRKAVATAVSSLSKNEITVHAERRSKTQRDRPGGRLGDQVSAL